MFALPDAWVPLAATSPPPTTLEWVGVAVSYLMGAIPFGLVIARLRGVDLRKVGSGNIGATNAMRGLGKPLGLFVFLLDSGKGLFAAALLASWFATGADGRLGGDPSLLFRTLCGGAAVIGHCFPIYLGFKGGKGVATACGTLLALDPWIFVVGGLVWIAMLLAFRYVGLASIAMGVSFPITAAVRTWDLGPEVTVGCVALCALILVRHRSNWKNVLAGVEPKVFGPKAAADTVGAGEVSAHADHEES